MLPGNPDLFGEEKAPAGMLGNPDFLGGETSLGTTLTDALLVGNQAFAQNPRLFWSGINNFGN